jgi:hypothetical protein
MVFESPDQNISSENSKEKPTIADSPMTAIQPDFSSPSVFKPGEILIARVWHHGAYYVTNSQNGCADRDWAPTGACGLRFLDDLKNRRLPKRRKSALLPSCFKHY